MDLQCYLYIRPDNMFVQGSFSSLDTLWLDLHVLQDGFVPLEFFKINHLGVSFARNTSSAVLSVFLKKFHNLETLQLLLGHMEEIFMNEELLDGEEPHVFAHLKTLDIGAMVCLRNIWKENSHLAGPVFPNLENLKVGMCVRLKNIVSSAVSLRNLVQLEVVECHGLRHLITCSVAKSFVQLQSIIVENCQTMVEIVASSDDNENIDDADANEITFCRLKDLKLSNLPNLKGFCSRNYNVVFPFLTTWSVTTCLEMKISVDGALLDDSKHNGVLQITEEEDDEEQEEEEGENDDNEDDNDDVEDYSEKCDDDDYDNVVVMPLFSTKFYFQSSL